MESTDSETRGLVSTQRVCARSQLQPKPFVLSYPYAFFDQYRIIRHELYLNPDP